MLAAAAKHLRVWFIKVRKIKGIYFTLNKFNFDVTNKCLIAEAWIPEIDLTRIKAALCKGAVSIKEALCKGTLRMKIHIVHIRWWF